MKITLFTLIIGWVLWGLGMQYISEYIFSRPTNGTIQFLSLIFILTMTVLLIKKTYMYIINKLNK
jgi:hypothetical protein